MGKKEEFAEIFDMLKDVAAHRGQPILESELREMTKRCFEYRQGPELYRIILAISTDKYYPSSHELENRVRLAKGLRPLRSLTEERIEQNERELVVSGQDPRKAAGGAEILRKTLRREHVEIKPEIVASFAVQTMLNNGEISETGAIDALEAINADPLAALENFDDEEIVQPQGITLDDLGEVF